MDRFEVDRDSIFFLYTLYKQGRICFEPVYQRGRVWTNELRYALIDSIKQEFPIGLVMFNVVPHVDLDGTRVEKFDVVDGQQRMRTIMEYVDGHDWAIVENVKGFVPFKNLSDAKQNLFKEYKIPVAKMKEFEPEEITECYNRLQTGKALKLGEKLKSLTTYSTHPYVKDLSKHRIFDLDDRLKVRDGHWALATAFLKSIYQNDLFARQEHRHLSEFLRTQQIDSRKAGKSLEQCRQILNYECKVLEEALRESPDFRRYAQTARALKWLFATIAAMRANYSLSGREHLVARGTLNYYALIAREGTDEWVAYMNTGRTGRIDTKEVKDCLVHLANQILLASNASPLDDKRFFTPEQRNLIYRNSGGKCDCGIELSLSNFHADHIRPHSAGGPTTVSNGRALCSKCNRQKGNTWKESVAIGAVPAGI